MDSAKSFAKEYQETSGRRPFLSFGDQQPHTLKLVKDKRDKMDDPNNPGQTVDGVRFVVEKEGVEMEFFTSSIALIQKLAVCDTGEVVTVQQVKNKGPKGFRTTYKVTRGDSEIKTAHETETETEAAEAEPAKDPNW